MSREHQGNDSPVLDGLARGPIFRLWRRIVLTWRYHGPWSVAFRVATFPLRATPVGHRLGFGSPPDVARSTARSWYRRNGRAVAVVIPSYRDAALVTRLVRSIRRTTRRGRAQIIVSDDCSGPEHLSRLRRIRGITVIESESNTGFAANVNRGLRAADRALDVVVLNSDVVARRHWLDVLQYSALETPGVGIVGAKLLYRDGRIQFAGTVRNPAAPQWFDHRYRFRPARFGPASVPGPVLAVTGACMYISRVLLDEIGEFDEGYPMAYEDVDFCLRCWQAGHSVQYAPSATLEHSESATRGTELGARELASQRYFWQRWGDFFDARPVRDSGGLLRIVYVTESTDIYGGHRDIFEHLNRLAARGHDVSLYSLGREPEWFDLGVPTRMFPDYEALVDALAPLDAIKVATWWKTARPVWLASVLHGTPVYFVQDIEASYYPDDEGMRLRVLASYQTEFRYLTISTWIRDRLQELGVEAQLVSPGVDLATFHPRGGVARREDMLLAAGRSHPLKNLPLTLAAWHALGEPRPELRLFGAEPELASKPGIVFERTPSDDRLAELFCEAGVFVQTSTHEGFCLPILEAMASGTPVVCTDADGNRDFCVDGENCLMVADRAEDVAAAVARVLADQALGKRLAAAGIRTAGEYSWESRIDALERFFGDVATPRRVKLDTASVPDAIPSGPQESER
jgi:GT2 family glycosyltransferase